MTQGRAEMTNAFRWGGNGLIRYRRSLAAAGLAVVVSFSTACGGGQGNGDTPDKASVPTPSISETAPAGPSVTADKIIKTDKGEYLHSTITDDDPAMKYDPTVVHPGTESSLPREQLEDAHRFTVKYIANHVIDSPLNDDASTVDSWWEEHKGMYDPRYHEAIRAEFDEKDGPLVRNKWHKDVKEFDYHYVYSPDETRISERSIKVTEIYYTETGMVVLTSDYSYSAKVPTPDGVGTERIKGTYTLGLRPSSATMDGWTISSYDSKYEVLEVVDPAK